MACSSRRRVNSVKMSRCVVTSRAVVGSSAMRTRGSESSAAAIATRCRMPPESSCGYERATRASSPTSARSARARCERSERLPVRAAVICTPHGSVGASDVKGSCGSQTIPPPRCFFKRPWSDSRSYSCPPSDTVPLAESAEGVSAHSVRASIDFPAPDSPTMTRVRPKRAFTLTSSTITRPLRSVTLTCEATRPSLRSRVVSVLISHAPCARQTSHPQC